MGTQLLVFPLTVVGKPLPFPLDRELVVAETWWEPRLLGRADRSFHSYCLGDASASLLTEPSVAIQPAYGSGVRAARLSGAVIWVQPLE